MSPTHKGHLSSNRPRRVKTPGKRPRTTAVTSPPPLGPIFLVHLVAFFVVVRVLLWLRKDPYSVASTSVSVPETVRAMHERRLPFRAVSITGNLQLAEPPHFGSGLQLENAGFSITVFLNYWSTRRLFLAADTDLLGQPAVVHGWIRYVRLGGVVVPWAVDVGSTRVRFRSWWVEGLAGYLVLTAAVGYLAFWTLSGFWPAAIPLAILILWLLLSATAASTPRRPS